MAPLLPRLHSIMSISAQATDWAVSIIELGALLSALPSGYLADRWGRKKMLLGASFLALLSWTLVLSSRKAAILLTSRFLLGLLEGVITSCVPLYIAEITEPHLRGPLCGHFQTFWNLGIFLTYVAGLYCSYDIYIGVSAALPLLFLVTFYWMPESPYYLLMQGQELEAEESLKWLRVKKDVSEELQDILSTVREAVKEKAGWGQLIASRQDILALTSSQSVVVVKYFTGHVAITNYVCHVLEVNSGNVLPANTVVLVFGACLTLASFVSACTANRLGRRLLLISSALGCSLFTFILAAYFFLANSFTSYTWVLGVSLTGFSVFSSFGVSPLAQTIAAECFPSRTRALGNAVSSFTTSVSVSIVLIIYPVLANSLGEYFNYVLYGCSGLIGSIIFYCLLEDTSGKSLTEIERQINFKKDVDSLP